MTERRRADDPARRRYFIIAFTRLIGAVLLIIGVATVRGMTGGSPELGYVLMVVGAIAVLVVPQWLVRKWRSPR
ncbi:MAG: hypothetical protein WA948_04185 [Pontixanthobacter sp.]